MPSSSISNSEGIVSDDSDLLWARFFRYAVGGFILPLALIFILVSLTDPYDTLPISLGFEREPISSNARFSFPGLARKKHFESAVIGTSTSRLLKPALLNQLFGSTFVNLSMNAATPYEQSRILDVFLSSHPAPLYVIIGIDIVWCHSGSPSPKFTQRTFPTWLYDENPWNDYLYLINRETIEQAGRQAARALGLRDPKHGLDGYTNFLPPQSEYDLGSARLNIYGSVEPKAHDVQIVAGDMPISHSEIDFTALPILDQVLSKIPRETRKILFFVPYHRYHQGGPGSLGAQTWGVCKKNVQDITRDYHNVDLIDFMIPSRITMLDENYWDPIHYGVNVADMLAVLLWEGSKNKIAKANYYEYLGE